MTTAFEVLAEPARRRILDLLLDRERSVNELVGLLGLSQPGVSKHLRVLREAGLVRVRQDAQRRWYQIRPEPLAEIDAWLQPYRRYWNARLDALERHLNAMPATTRPATSWPDVSGQDAPGPAGADRASADAPNREDPP